MVWKKWLHDEWEKPSRTDKYIQRLTYIVDTMFSQEKPDEDNYRLKFKKASPMKPAQTTDTPTRSIPIDPTGETVIAPPNPDTVNPPSSIPFSQEKQRVQEFLGDADPSTIVDADSGDEAWKRQRRIWLKYAGIATDAEGKIIRKDDTKKR
jgi:hypothetical protein